MTNQMKEFASMISAAMGTTFAQVATTHALGTALFLPNSGQDGSHVSEEKESEEEQGKEQDEVDNYNKSLDNILDKQEVVGPDI